MDKEFFKEIMKTVSPSGMEESLQKLVYSRYKNDCDKVLVDNQGTLTFVYNESSDFKVMLAAHTDEIGLIVTGYNSDGSLTVQKNGGIRPSLYVGSKVRVLANGKIYHGVCGTNSRLVKKGDIDATDLFIYMGFSSKDEAMIYIPKGSYIVHDTDIVDLENDFAAARAFDDKVGVFIIHEAAKKAKEMGASIGIYSCGTTGEETTGRGAYSSASKIKPNISVIVDVTYAADYIGADAEGDVRVGAGGVICMGSVPNRKLNDLLALCAKELDENVQYEVFSGRTGTDGDTIIKTNEAVDQVLFSIPLRYMHSPIEVLSYKDIESMINVLALFLTKINSNYSLLPYKLEE